MFDKLSEDQVTKLAWEVFGNRRHVLDLSNLKQEIVERKLGRKLDERLNDKHVLEAFETFDDFFDEVKHKEEIKIDMFIEKAVDDEKTYCAMVEQDLIKMGVDKSISDKFSEKFDMLCDCLNSYNIDLFKQTAKFIITGN